MAISRLLAMSVALLLIGSHLFGQQYPLRAAPPQDAVASRGSGGNAEHGRYPVERVATCFECHSTRDAQGIIVAGTRFMGGPLPVRPPWPSDWPLRAPRIGGLPGYTDELAIRLLTEGAIKREGTQLRRPMPQFRMTPQDAADGVAYLRSV